MSGFKIEPCFISSRAQSAHLTRQMPNRGLHHYSERNVQLHQTSTSIFRQVGPMTNLPSLGKIGSTKHVSAHELRLPQRMAGFGTGRTTTTRTNLGDEPQAQQPTRASLRATSPNPNRRRVQVDPPQCRRSSRTSNNGFPSDSASSGTDSLAASFCNTGATQTCADRTSRASTQKIETTKFLSHSPLCRLVDQVASTRIQFRQLRERLSRQHPLAKQRDSFPRRLDHPATVLVPKLLVTVPEMSLITLRG